MSGAMERRRREAASEGVASRAASRQVGAHLLVEVCEPVEMLLQVAAARRGGDVVETLQVTCDGEPIPVTEVAMPQSRVHQVRANPGLVEVRYRATVPSGGLRSAVSTADRIRYLRPSRYAESDRLVPTARAEFAGISGDAELLAAVSSWVGARLAYVPGSSGPTDGAVDSLLLRRGVCRDYAHLVVGLLRALDVPSRLASVYAPGLAPMDFHAVAEAAVGGIWRVVDATLLAPRASLVRIATGRDAADTAFLSTYGGTTRLVECEVQATIDGPLPGDDILELVSVP